MAKLIKSLNEYRDIFSKFSTGTKIGQLNCKFFERSPFLYLGQYYSCIKAQSLFDVTIAVFHAFKYSATSLDDIEKYISEWASILPCDYVYFDKFENFKVPNRWISSIEEDIIKSWYKETFNLDAIAGFDYSFFESNFRFKINYLKREVYLDTVTNLPGLNITYIEDNSKIVPDNLYFLDIDFIKEIPNIDVFINTPRVYIPTYRYKTGIKSLRNDNGSIYYKLDIDKKTLDDNNKINFKILKNENKHLYKLLNKKLSTIDEIKDIIDKNIPTKHSYLLINPLTLAAATNNDLDNNMVMCIVYPYQSAILSSDYVEYPRSGDFIWLGFKNTDIFERSDGYVGFRNDFVSNDIDIFIDSVYDEMMGPSFSESNKTKKYSMLKIYDWWRNKKGI